MSGRFSAPAWERQADEFVYTVRGNGFLHHMVRNLVGTFLLVGKGTLNASDLAADSAKPAHAQRQEPQRRPAVCAW